MGGGGAQVTTENRSGKRKQWMDGEGEGVYPQECRHVLVVGQRGGEADEADERLRRLHVPLRPGDDALNHGATFIRQQVHLRLLLSLAVVVVAWVLLLVIEVALCGVVACSSAKLRTI